MARPGHGGKSKIAKSELSVENHWQTPEWVLELARGILGGIELDPCTTPDNPTGAERIYTPADDGILMPWTAQRIFVNPPYGWTIRHWIQKSIDAGKDGAKVIVLVPARFDSSWFQYGWECSDDTFFFRKRLTFKGAPRPAPFASVLFGYGVSFDGIVAHGYRAKIEAA